MMRTSLILCGLLAGVASLAYGADASPQHTATNPPAVFCWQPHDFSFTAQAQSANPFMVAFSATVTGPDGKTFTLPGFFDGNGTWKIRVSPTAEGNWSLLTQSELPELNGRRATFTGVKNPSPHAHGILRVDPEHPHHFIFDDGSRFFMQAYEYNWLFALDMGNPDVPTIKQTLDLIAAHGFNYVIVNSYAHDMSSSRPLGYAGIVVRPNILDTDDYGPPALYPWAGNNDAPDHTQLNLAFWQHYDRMIDALLARGMQAHVYITVHNKHVKWPARGSAEEKLFFTTLIARYAAYPNIIWDVSKEAQRLPLAYKLGVFKFFRATDPYGHLQTAHDDDGPNDRGAYDELTDFRADQHHGIAGYTGENAYLIGCKHEKILAQRQRRAWPVANVESDYECGPGGVTDTVYPNRGMTAEATATTLWDIAMAGGYTGYYYTYTAWDVIRPLDVPKGYTYMKYFGEFWRATKFWLLQPSSELVSTGRCLANPGKEYIIFQNEATPFELNLSGLSKPLQAVWFQPFSGEYMDAGEFKNGALRISPPSVFGAGPVVLHISSFHQGKRVVTPLIEQAKRKER